VARIFISYRRNDSSGWVGRLASDLESRFGAGAVFKDIDTIEAGEDFVAVIEQALQSCSVVLVVIGPDWSSVQDKSGARRLHDPDDLVRLEVAKAIQRHDLRVIPVLVGGAGMPTANELPEDLRSLSRRNAFDLSDKRWDYDLAKLADTLAKVPGLVVQTPAEGGAQKASEPTISVKPARRVSAKVVILGMVSIAALAALWFASIWQKETERPKNQEARTSEPHRPVSNPTAQHFVGAWKHPSGVTWVIGQKGDILVFEQLDPRSGVTVTGTGKVVGQELQLVFEWTSDRTQGEGRFALSQGGQRLKGSYKFVDSDERRVVELVRVH
jgi:hypothetical protein